MKDVISRQVAIDLVRDICNAIMCECESHYDDEVGDEVYEDVREVDAILKCNKRIRKALRKMPSAQPEPLTDKEQRIFLAAMAREEEVCRKTDDECRDCREPYEDSIVRTCHEITRKVRGALWTI